MLARIKHNPAVTLIDLKNAVGEVDHTLLAEVLKKVYHKVSDHRVILITSLHTDYFNSVATDNYLTSLIKVRRGVLQVTAFHNYCLI